MQHHYSLCGIRVASEIPLRELLPWTGSELSRPSLTFRYGSVPERLESPDHCGPVFQVKGKSYLLNVPGSVRFLIHDGREVTIDLAGHSEPDASPLLTGPVQGVVFHQRGLLPLHASTVAKNGRALAIAAPSGTGKSTLAAALAQQDFTVLGDDICVVHHQRDTVPAILPTYPRLRLWRDSMRALRLDVQACPQAIRGKEKYLVDKNDHRSFSESLPLSDLIQLVHRADAQAPSLERLQGLAAMQAIQCNVHVRRPALALGLGEFLFHSAATLAKSCRVWRLTRPGHFRCLEELTAAVAGIAEQPC